MSLHRLLYLSSATEGLSYPDLREIMAKSEANNLRDGITGMLCFGNNMFVQTLEGDRRRISDTYGRILQDPRHHSAEIVEFCEIDSRIFTNWSMRLVQLGEMDSETMRTLRLTYSPAATFEPAAMNAKQCLSFLKELYVIHQGGG
ncbi:BLUF domain-containing protein [Candidatus Synechococcus calcipolaris G9]|uniref:BLUF domain-containing protein n=1 Tax=Candidatus Synechococcus calcipolaris G9 TaxID=1497997 RepID=A0ABT6F024_9SYNE|nr:BLUF domain-containing protein [Candidatus Synechococcus calcipolaris]MDG2991177.1 BLUF domain-containing protein [Candidatus Synechococcus calcipolaris G9]